MQYGLSSDSGNPYVEASLNYYRQQPQLREEHEAAHNLPKLAVQKGPCMIGAVSNIVAEEVKRTNYENIFWFLADDREYITVSELMDALRNCPPCLKSIKSVFSEDPSDKEYSIELFCSKLRKYERRCGPQQWRLDDRRHTVEIEKPTFTPEISKQAQLIFRNRRFRDLDIPCPIVSRPVRKGGETNASIGEGAGGEVAGQKTRESSKGGRKVSEKVLSRTFDRLYRLGQAQQQLTKTTEEGRRMREATEGLQDCTFTPKISERSRKMARRRTNLGIPHDSLHSFRQPGGISISSIEILGNRERSQASVHSQTLKPTKLDLQNSGEEDKGTKSVLSLIEKALRL